MTMEIKGRNLVDGLPKNIVVHSEDVREALLECLVKITDAIKETLERTPPELSADIIGPRITLTGGGALLRGLDKLIQSETGIDVHVAENPLGLRGHRRRRRAGPCGCAARRAGHRRGPHVKLPRRPGQLLWKRRKGEGLCISRPAPHTLSQKRGWHRLSALFRPGAFHPVEENGP